MSRSEAFDPYTPLNVLKPIAAGVWIVDGPEIQFSYLGLKFPFPTRMTLIRLPDGGLWVHSPTSLTDALAGQVLQAGPVQFLIAPNTLHYWWIPDWKMRFPDALVYAAPRLERSAKRPPPVDQVLDSVPPPAWAGIIDQAVVRGDMLTEVAFMHYPSRTLVLTDLIENFELKRTHSRSSRLLVRLAGAADPDGKAPIDMQLTFWRHRKAVRAAVEYDRLEPGEDYHSAWPMVRRKLRSRVAACFSMGLLNTERSHAACNPRAKGQDSRSFGPSGSGSAPMLASAYDETNIFAKILRGELPCHKVYEDDVALAFMDIMPRVDGHVLVLPKSPARNILDADPAMLGKLIARVQKIAVAVKSALAADGITILQYNEPAGGQIVFHLHFHVLPRWKGVELRPHTGAQENPEVLEAFRAKIAAAIKPD
jgi:diadenosine tetraphosphate (Ap4A) HIT family hydrolase